MGYFINDQERAVLRGIDPRARAVYDLMRDRMDWRTGLVGRVTKISFQAIAEELEYDVPKGRGVMQVKPADTPQKVKDLVARLIEVLERVGLIVKKPGAFLVFFCPMADLAPVRPKQTGHERATDLPTKQATSHDFTSDCIRTCFDGFEGVETAERATPQNDPKGPNGPHIEDQRSTPPQSSSTTGRKVAPGDERAAGGLYRDRATPSQAGPLGQAGTTQEDPCRDRPAASHPALARRCGGGAEGVGTSDSGRQAEVPAGLAENESRPVGERSPAEIRAAELRAVLKQRRIYAPEASRVIDGWAAVQVTTAELGEALDRAHAERAKADSVQPINLGYLATIIKSMRSAARRGAEKARRRGVVDLDLSATALELGLRPAMPGEEMPAFRARVLAALEKREQGHG